MPTLELEKEFQYYLDNQDELVKSHFGRYIVIKDERVLGDFGTEVEAILYSKDNLNLKLGTFLIQHCLPGEENYTQFFHSRQYPLNKRELKSSLIASLLLSILYLS
jgi:hypothetical protein